MVYWSLPYLTHPCFRISATSKLARASGRRNSPINGCTVPAEVHGPRPHEYSRQKIADQKADRPRATNLCDVWISVHNRDRFRMNILGIFMNNIQSLSIIFSKNHRRKGDLSATDLTRNNELLLDENRWTTVKSARIFTTVCPPVRGTNKRKSGSRKLYRAFLFCGTIAPGIGVVRRRFQVIKPCGRVADRDLYDHSRTGTV